MTPITVEYRSRRSEVWAQYWSLWRERLWRFHVVWFAVFFAILAVGFYAPDRSLPLILAEAAGFAAIPTVLFASYPMLMFKPQVRRLTIDDIGIDTAIGRKSARAGWEKIEEVEDRGNMIVIRNLTGNAYLIPDRAFSSAAQRGEFLEGAKRAWAAAKP